MARTRKPLTEEQRARNREANKAWKERNKDNPEYREKKRASWRAYRERNLEKCRECINKWKRENRDKVRDQHTAYSRKWRSENRDKVSAWNAAYRAKNAARFKRIEKNPEEARIRVLNQNTLFAAASSAVPRGLPAWKRQDIISDIVLAVLEGTLAVEDIAKQAKDFVKRFNRQFSEYMHAQFDEAFMAPVAAE